MYHCRVPLASRFVLVSYRFDHLFDISSGLSRCASAALNISIAVLSRFVMDVHGSSATVLARQVTVHIG